MSRAFELSLVLILATSLIACAGNGGGDADRVLRLNYGEFTEREVREHLSDPSEFFEIQCAALAELSDDEAFDALIQIYSLSSPGGNLVAEDERRLVEIMREQCAAVDFDEA